MSHQETRLEKETVLGWFNEVAAYCAFHQTPPHSVTPEETITHGRIIPLGHKVKQAQQLRADYVLLPSILNKITMNGLLIILVGASVLDVLPIFRS